MFTLGSSRPVINLVIESSNPPRPSPFRFFPSVLHSNIKAFGASRVEIFMGKNNRLSPIFMLHQVMLVFRFVCVYGNPVERVLLVYLLVSARF